jgi:hypothetical protein
MWRLRPCRTQVIRVVASDGGIFAFGDADFYGSTGAVPLNASIVGMAATADGHGYWLVVADGGIFTLAIATQCSSYTAALAATGGAAPYSWIPPRSPPLGTQSLVGRGHQRHPELGRDFHVPGAGDRQHGADTTDGDGDGDDCGYCGAAPAVVTTTTLPDAVAGTAYSAALNAGGGNSLDASGL